jgi:phosphoenolpyruvate carboxylase
MRVFLARSDPALISGLVPAVLGNKIALSELYQWSAKRKIDVYPWLGAGSLPFRGHVRPDRVDYFLKTYPGVRSVTIQSSFRYDFPIETVKKGIAAFNTKLSKTQPVILSGEELHHLTRAVNTLEKPYQKTILSLADTINDVARNVPSRRERRLHIGLLGYGRKMGKAKLPRAITFTAAMYSLGVPPELVGTGRGLASLSKAELAAVEKHYPTLMFDLAEAGQYLNTENLDFLAKKHTGFREIQEDIELLQAYIGMPMGPRSETAFIHRNWTSTLFFLRKGHKQITTAIRESAKIRQSLG